MGDQTLQPPQPIPYPDHPMLKRLYRLPIVLYRLGLGPLIGKYILILSHSGRKSGKIYHTPVEYFQHQGRIFVMSGFGGRPDWYQNLLADPQAGLTIKRQIVCVRARPPQGNVEWEGVIAFLKTSPAVPRSEQKILARMDDHEIRTAIQSWPVLTFDPSEKPCPPPLEADLAWTWPLTLLAAALILLAGWLAGRRQ